MIVKERGDVEFIPFGAQDKVKLNVRIVQTLIAEPTKSGKFCSDKDALKFIAMCHAKKLNPFEGDAFLIGYDTQDGPKYSLITAHQTYLKRAEMHPEFDGMKSGLIVRDKETKALSDIEGDFYLPDEQEILGAWATVFFKTRKIPMHKRVRLARFQKNFGVWKDDPAGMIVKVCESDSLRSSFPTLLGGLYLKDELPFPDQRMIPAKPNFEKSATTVSFPEPENTAKQPAATAFEPAAEEKQPAAKSGFARPEPQAQTPEPQDDGDPFADQAEERPIGPDEPKKDDWRNLPVLLGKNAGKPFGSLSESELRWWVETFQPNKSKPMQIEVRKALNLAAIELGMVAPQEQVDIPS